MSRRSASTFLSARNVRCAPDRTGVHACRHGLCGRLWTSDAKTARPASQSRPFSKNTFCGRKGSEAPERGERRERRGQVRDDPSFLVGGDHKGDEFAQALSVSEISHVAGHLGPSPVCDVVAAQEDFPIQPRCTRRRASSRSVKPTMKWLPRDRVELGEADNTARRWSQPWNLGATAKIRAATAIKQIAPTPMRSVSEGYCGSRQVCTM